MVAIAAAADGADHVPREEPGERVPVEAAPRRHQRSEGKAADEQQRDELDRGLPVLLARSSHRPHLPVRSVQSRTRSTGLTQSFAIRRPSEGLIVWPGKRLSGCRNP
jgi:hypothetical protein